MEEVLIKAIKEIITDTKIKLCYFHFSESIMRRIHNSIYEDLFQRLPFPKTLISFVKLYHLLSLNLFLMSFIN